MEKNEGTISGASGFDTQASTVTEARSRLSSSSYMLICWEVQVHWIASCEH